MRKVINKMVSEDDLKLLQQRVARGVEIFMAWYGV